MVRNWPAAKFNGEQPGVNTRSLVSSIQPQTHRAAEGLELSLWLVQLSLWLSLTAATVVAVSISNIPVTAGFDKPFECCVMLDRLVTNDQRWTRK